MRARGREGVYKCTAYTPPWEKSGKSAPLILDLLTFFSYFPGFLPALKIDSQPPPGVRRTPGHPLTNTNVQVLKPKEKVDMTTKTDIVPVPERRVQAGLWAASLGREAVTYQLFMLPSGLSVTALAEVLPPEQWAAIESTCNDLEARGLAIRAGDPETVSLTEQGREHACVVD